MKQMYALYKNLISICLVTFVGYGLVWTDASVYFTERISARNRFYPKATISNQKKNISLSDCAILCETTSCLSFYYNKADGSCVLQRVLMSSDDDVFAANWTYFEMAGKRSPACNYSNFYLYDDGTNLCFKVHQNSSSCSAARAFCASEGASLISIDSQRKLDYMKKVLEAENLVADAYTIGGFHDDVSGTWRWENGANFTYTNWIDGVTPDDGFCVTMVTRLDLLWNRIADDQFKEMWKYPFVCERK
ncbi:hypothetical protein CHS0354_008121 [Potamilus streckersoni]|uniref:C-type lectin domain-containing protein n=1 Tax=Potamilus streckersoni TaxID=2493646 RepID=A0AAE0SZM3_9BIVA|nr:hypothetical protein CHS0354_008121 [Potamilus streckersoni]